MKKHEAKARNIVVKGAREHNLKNIDLEIPSGKLVVFTGVSGSGKSSLVFDTIYAEGQRRYVESLSSYARQFLERINKPDVDLITGIAPAVSIEQKTVSKNNRSTVGTTTEIYDYLRLLFARIGKTECFVCGKEVKRASTATVTDFLESHDDSGKWFLGFPMHDHEGRSVAEEIDLIKKRGFFRVFFNDEMHELGDNPTLPEDKKAITVIAERFKIRKGEMRERLADSIEMCFKEGEQRLRLIEISGEYRVASSEISGEISGELRVASSEISSESGDSTPNTKHQTPNTSSPLTTHHSPLITDFNQFYECCGIRYEEPEPRFFSFNNPFGACPVCQGFSKMYGIDMNLVVPNDNLSIVNNAIAPWKSPKYSHHNRALIAAAKKYNIPINEPFRYLSEDHVNLILNGAPEFTGLRHFFEELEQDNYKMQTRIFLARYRGYTDCTACRGTRLRREALQVKIAGKSIHDVVIMPIEKALGFFESLELSEYDANIADRILKELVKRLNFLNDVGLGYLTMDRVSSTLSGGESQRINLATALGSALVGTLYVLDEPSIGLHPRDNSRLIKILKNLRDIGNSVLVVEHDPEMMENADVIVDMGPRAGQNGGEIVAQGTYDELIRNPRSLTGLYLSGARSIPLPKTRNTEKGFSITIKGAREHNLKSVDVEIPLSKFVVVTGVSGSGKSTLVHDVIYGNIAKNLGGAVSNPGKCDSISGEVYLDAIEIVDQSPIGKSPRSNPASYVKAFENIREAFAGTHQAKQKGFSPGYFSFNIPGGRCETCQGEGFIKVEMQFLADIYLECEECKGTRYKKEVRDITLRGKNLVEVLNMTVAEALQHFEGYNKITKPLQVLADVGLDYMKLGQPGNTLSGGEAQRIKLALHLSQRKDNRHTLFIFDEPTTGLHFDDISKLLRSFELLIENNNSVLLIEHNLDVIKCADHVIDLGPEAGDKGGYIVATGTPEEIAEHPDSWTGRYLKPYLEKTEWEQVN
ncbi:MAG: UvrABC system protein A [Chlorobiota bacterium]